MRTWRAFWRMRAKTATRTRKGTSGTSAKTMRYGRGCVVAQKQFFAAAVEEAEAAAAAVAAAEAAAADGDV